jgi:hypothetical protein
MNHLERTFYPSDDLQSVDMHHISSAIGIPQNNAPIAFRFILLLEESLYKIKEEFDKGAESMTLRLSLDNNTLVIEYASTHYEYDLTKNNRKE